MASVTENSLVLYKNSPARVLKVSDKIEIELADGETVRVRPKDITLLHPGPLPSLAALKPPKGEVMDAWEILAGTETSLRELAELAFGEYRPDTAWAAWQLVADGLYFRGTPERVSARPKAEVESESEQRTREAEEKRAWAQFLEHARAGKVLPDERKLASEAEALALGRSAKSRILRELGTNETPENAHAFLLKVGYWNETMNPYPSRFELPWSPPKVELLELPTEERRDLTHLAAFAIDDEGNKDPDDALSLDGERLWVHVADVGALVPPDSPADRVARGIAANLYLPERTVPMLPVAATEQLGLGLGELSPALSFGLTLSEDGTITSTEVVPSRVRVTRITYEQAETRLDESPFREMIALVSRFHARRKARATCDLDLPEVKIRLDENGDVLIKRLPNLRSRELVTEAMLMAGEAAARIAIEKHIPFPFTTQSPPDVSESPTTLSGMFQYRKRFKRSQMKTSAEPHAGLGLETYARATSPLRRYLDLLVHQQLRAHLDGRPVLGPQEVLSRVGEAEAVLGTIRRAERYANLHWTLVYLLRNPGWRGRGILVDKAGTRGTFLIPDLALEERIHLDRDLPLDTELELGIQRVNLPLLSAHFKVL